MISSVNIVFSGIIFSVVFIPFISFFNKFYNNQHNTVQIHYLQYRLLGNKYRVCGVYSPEPRAEAYCFKLNFNISKLVYCLLKHVREALGHAAKRQKKR